MGQEDEKHKKGVLRFRRSECVKCGELRELKEREPWQVTQDEEQGELY